MNSLFKITRRSLILVALVALSTNLHAESEASDTQTSDDFLATVSGRFRPYEPNYAIWQYSDNDADALEVHFSFKYLVFSPEVAKHCSSRCDPERISESKIQGGRETYIKYTGEFDFYYGTRFSGPVINRLNNPGVHHRQYFGDHSLFGALTLKYYDIGLQHLSNGQVQDAQQIRNGQFRAQTIFDLDPHSPYFDTISRGANFVSFETSFRFGSNRSQADVLSGRCRGLADCYDLWVRLIPWYIDDDNPVTWGPDAGRRSRVADYDRLRIILSKTTSFGKHIARGNPRDSKKQLGFSEIEFGIEWTLGDDLFETDSFDVYTFVPLESGKGWRIPFYIRYHHGPMSNLADYTKNQNSIGVGLRLY